MEAWMVAGGVLQLRDRRWMYMTCDCSVQGEDRDSSDEEWATAYATMDAASQLGWRSRRGVVEGPAEELMRDIMETADVVHSNSMSNMAGSRNSNNESIPVADDSSGASMPRHIGESRSPSASIEVDQQGAHPLR
jgi:hypothetical protein